LLVFKTSAFNRSAISPKRIIIVHFMANKIEGIILE
jgi:hypothetical protein